MKANNGREVRTPGATDETTSNQQLLCDGGKETFEHVTWLEATNADTQALVFGEESDQKMSVAELVDSKPVRVRRYYEVQLVIDLPREMTREEVHDWLQDHHDDTTFDDFDWDTWEDRELFDVVVENRNQFKSMLGDIEDRLNDLQPLDAETSDELDDIRDDITSVLFGGTPVEINEIEKPAEVADD
jgi:hypothetical protein